MDEEAFEYEPPSLQERVAGLEYRTGHDERKTDKRLNRLDARLDVLQRGLFFVAALAKKHEVALEYVDLLIRRDNYEAHRSQGCLSKGIIDRAQSKIDDRLAELEAKSR